MEIPWTPPLILAALANRADEAAARLRDLVEERENGSELRSVSTALFEAARRPRSRS